MLSTVLEYILNEQRLDRFFIILFFGAPVLCVPLAYGYGKVRNKVKSSVFWGMFTGFTISLISGMWWVYNLIMNHYGLDSVKALLINIGIFSAMGVILGLVLRKIISLNKTVGDDHSSQ